MNQREKDLLDLFIHPGWKLVIADMRDALQTLVETTHHLKSEQELYFRKGQIQKLSEMVSFEDITKMQLNEDTE